MKILDIIDFGNNGEGIAKDDGKVYFVPKTIVGEKVQVKVVKEKSNFCNCKLETVLTEDKKRIKPVCKYFDICGGCQLQHLGYTDQLPQKRISTQNTINKISKLNVEINDIMPSDKNYHYRNKMVFAFDKFANLCMHDESGKLFELDFCHLATMGINKILSIVGQFVKSSNLIGYDQITKKGLLRYLVVRELNDEFLITLVCTKAEVPGIKNLIKALDNNFIKYGLFINVNTSNSSLILTEKFVHICGLKNLIGQYICKNGKVIKYPISPLSFMQVNDNIKERIYDMAQETLQGTKLIIDAYSGAGLLTAILSQIADQVVGIEIVSQATKDADDLARANNITNMKNINSDCVVGIDKALNKGKCDDFAIVLDPPRKGVDQVVLEKVISLSPNKIVYISCNPATLARDLVTLTKKYKITKILPCDMFPNTSEVETFVVLEKIK